MSDRTADALVLVFTQGVSLKQWDRTGLLGRESLLYEPLASGFGTVVFVTDGDHSDIAIAEKLPFRALVVCNEARLPEHEHHAALPGRVAGLLRGSKSAIVKTNQMVGGERAVAIAVALRGAGVRTGLIARGGYLHSRFVASQFGPESVEAIEAGASEGELCRAADAVVASTETMIDDLRWRYGLSVERTVVQPNFVADADPGYAEAEREPGEILYAGQLVRRKRVDILIDAMAYLPDVTRKGAFLTVIGDGEERENLQEQAKRLGVDVRFEGRIPHTELIERLKACAIYAQASELEGHPKTVLEAMGAGCAVVVADTPGQREVVEHGVNGLRIAPDPLVFARTFDVLLNDRELCIGLGMSAANCVSARFGLAQTIELERRIHKMALVRAGEAAQTPPGAVRWGADLLKAGAEQQVEAWSRSLSGFARRLSPKDRARFLLGLDDPLYKLQGLAAVEADGGLHPKHRLMRYHDFFTQRVEPGQRVLDLGCGVGALGASIAMACDATVVGMDLSDTSLEKARARAASDNIADRMTLVHGDITKDRAEGSFDVIVLSNVLEHLADRPGLLAKYAAWYSPKKFLIRVPAFDREWRVPWKRELGVEWRLDPTHETEHTREQLEAELGSAGLRITEFVCNWGEYWLVAVPEAVEQRRAG